MATAQGCSKPGCLQAATDRFMCGAGHHPYCTNEHRKNGEKTTIKTGEDLNEFLVNSAANFPRPAVEKRPIELSEPAGS